MWYWFSYVTKLFNFQHFMLLGNCILRTQIVTLRFLDLLQNLDKYQTKLFPVLCFSLRNLETAKKMVRTLDSSDKLKVVHNPDFTLLLPIAVTLPGWLLTFLSLLSPSGQDGLTDNYTLWWTQWHAHIIFAILHLYHRTLLPAISVPTPAAQSKILN